MKNNTKFLARSGLIAALYAALVLIAQPLSSGAVQLRIAEALTVLPLFTPAGVAGVTLGCLLGNLITGCALPDVVFGTLATLLGAVFTRYFRERRLLPLFGPVISNSLIIPPVLRYAYGIPGSLPWLMLTVGTGELLSAVLLGSLLRQLLERNRTVLFSDDKG